MVVSLLKSDKGDCHGYYILFLPKKEVRFSGTEIFFKSLDFSENIPQKPDYILL